MENHTETHSHRWHDPRGWNTGWHIVAVGIFSFFFGFVVAPHGVSQEEYQVVATEVSTQTGRAEEVQEELSLLEESQSQIEEEASSLREQLDKASSEVSLLREENQALIGEVDLLSSAIEEGADLPRVESTDEIARFEALIEEVVEPKDRIALCSLFSVSPRLSYDRFEFEVVTFEEFNSLMGKKCEGCGPLTCRVEPG